jgi:hypothetical protein
MCSFFYLEVSDYAKILTNKLVIPHCGKRKCLNTQYRFNYKINGDLKPVFISITNGFKLNAIYSNANILKILIFRRE